MSGPKNGVPASKDAEEKEENHLDRILDSPACRRLFTWARPKNADSRSVEMDEEIKEEQRLRWNFDFETETPLPGRYQWIKTDSSNGFRKNGSDVRRTLNGEVECRTSRQTVNTPYGRKTRTPHQQERSPRSTRSCDRPLNGPRRSERNSQVQLSDPTGYNLQWN